MLLRLSPKMLIVSSETVHYYQYTCDWCMKECIPSKSRIKPYGWTVMEEKEDEEGMISMDAHHFCSAAHQRLWTKDRKDKGWDL